MRSLRGAVADLLPVLAVEEDHFVTLGGRVGRMLACTGLNLSIASDETADEVAGLFAGVLNYLPADAHLELLAINRPLRAEDWVPRHLAQYRPPTPLRDYVGLLSDAYSRELRGRSIPDLRFYAVLSLPGPPAPRRGAARAARRQRLLARDRSRYQRALGDLEQAVAGLGQALAELAIQTTSLGRQGMIDLLWICANPDWSRDAAPPRAGAPGDLRALRDRLAQSRLTRRADYLRLDWGYETTLALRAMPELTFPGWLGRLTACGVQFRLAMHIVPLPKVDERTTLNRRLRQRHSILQERDRKGLAPDIDQRQAYEEAERLLTAMSAGDLRTYRTAIFVTVRAPSPEALAAATGRAVRALGDAGGTSIDRCQLWQVPAWGATLPLAENPAGQQYRTITPNLADSLPFLRHGAGTRGGPLIGFAQPGQEVVTLDMFDPALTNGNMIVVGRGGSGKTLFAQSFALKHLALGGRVIVLDRSEHHWDDLVKAVGERDGYAQVHDVGLDGAYRINPWQLPPGVAAPSQAKLDYLLDFHTLLLGELRGGSPHLTVAERAVLEAACRAVYSQTAQPRERDLYRWLLEQAQAPGDDALREARHLGLAERLSPYVEAGTYARLLDGPTTVRPDALLEVFNFKHLADHLVPIAMLPLIEYLWAAIADPARPTLLVLDEGWKLLEHPASGRFLAEVARTGRHHGIVTLNLSQFVTDYTGDLGDAVLKNSSVTLLLNQHPKLLPEVQAILGLTDDERAAVAKLRTVKREKAGAYLHADSGADSGAVDLYVTPLEYWLFTSHKAERDLRQAAIARHDGDVWAAVRDLAAMTPEQRDRFRDLADGVTAHERRADLAAIG